MKASFLPVLLLLVASSSIAQLSVTEKEAVAYAKALDVKILDPSLPSQGLEDWLQNGPPHIETLRWQSDDTCDLHPDSSDRDYPRCVRIAFARGGQEGYFLVLIGSLKRGIIGPPQLYYGPDVVEPGFVQTGSTDRLSGLPHLLDLPAVTGGVSDLYQKIVAQHRLVTYGSMPRTGPQTWRMSASMYSSRNEARTANSMLATMFVFVSSAFGETGASFSLFMSHLIALCYRNLQNPSNGADDHIGLRGEFSTENATGGDSIGLPDSTFQLWLRLPPATSAVQSGYE